MNAIQQTLVQHDEMIHAISPDATNQNHAFHKCILPRIARCREYLFDAHAFNALLKLVPIDRISITQQMLWCRILRERFNGLLTGPPGSRMRRDI